MNTRAVSLVRYSGPSLKWTREELQQKDHRTRQLMMMHKALNLRYDMHRLYDSRKGGKILSIIEDSVDASIQWLEDNVKKPGGRLNKATKNNTDNTSINKTKISRKRWKKKKLSGYFKWQTNEISYEKTWTLLRKGNHKREIENLLIAVHINATMTNYVKVKIYKTQEKRKWKLCGDED